MGFDKERRYRSDDRDLEGRDCELVLSMGGNGDWYAKVVKTGEKLGPSVRITTSGAPRGQDMVAPAVHGLYRALGGERPFVLTSRDDLLADERDGDMDEPKVVWESNYRRLGQERNAPIRVLDNGTVEVIVPQPAEGELAGWRKLSAEPAATWAWKHALENLTGRIEQLKSEVAYPAPADVFVGTAEPSKVFVVEQLPPSPEHQALLTRIATIVEPGTANHLTRLFAGWAETSMAHGLTMEQLHEPARVFAAGYEAKRNYDAHVLGVDG
jgi:hypothetical protein